MIVSKLWFFILWPILMLGHRDQKKGWKSERERDREKRKEKEIERKKNQRIFKSLKGDEFICLSRKNRDGEKKRFDGVSG